MKVPAICVNCNSTITVNHDDGAVTCPYCGKPFFAEMAITKFNEQYVSRTQAAIEFAERHER